MRVNLSKTKVIVFRNGGFRREDEMWFCNGQPIKTASAFKYMELHITPKLIWTHAKSCLATQARKEAIISLVKLQGRVGYFEFTDMFKLLWC